MFYFLIMLSIYYSSCVILMTLLFFVLFWWFCDSCMQINALVTAKSKQNQNKHLYHFLDFLQVEPAAVGNCGLAH
jgi:hypothetical protein